ncbi:uncharacterized protein LOC115699687 isoform X3 [Cannabis sativa]|uniref:LysM domain-containing protein n=1 Tax=Cannabis sativa TaxID=3483 RepID=A0A803QWP5_CANSA|nr:uncharacterized protein LOC115699687 isoform X3 [Cannabis sativa]
MEVQLRQTPPHFLLPLFQSKPNFPIPSHSLFFKSWANSTGFLKKHLRGSVEKWRFHIQEMSEGQCSAKHYLVHVVKRGETLSSISKQHGVSMYEIAAANRNIVDVDLVFEGQQLNIPSASTLIQAVGRSWSAYFRLPKKDHFSLNILNGVLDQKNLSVLYYRCTPHDQSEDLVEISFEESSHDYRKLEQDYQEFLTKCGMSNWGYWRGGSTR